MSATCVKFSEQLHSRVTGTLIAYGTIAKKGVK